MSKMARCSGIRKTGSENSFSLVLQKENALQVNSVVENLFDILPIDEVKKCRQVCQVWKAEGFRILRKNARIKLETKSRQKEFLKWSCSSDFFNFSFTTAEWDEDISSYLKLVKPTNFETVVNLIMNNDEEGKSIERFDDLLCTFSDSVTKLTVNIDWAGTIRYLVPDRLLPITYMQLKTLIINNDHIEAPWLNPLWISIVANSPNLERLELHSISDVNLWQGLVVLETFGKLKELSYAPGARVDVSQIHVRIFHNPYPMHCLRRIRISFREQIVPQQDLENLLAKLSPSLEVLEFVTSQESALSPVTFPVLPNLWVLDAGSSQFSFPTISAELLPKLKEIKATYWDWVYTTENLPDVHYYWRTDNPHLTVKDFHIRFPNWFLLGIHYQRLENFSDFAGVVRAKFPNVCNFTFHNVPLRDDVRRGLEMFFAIFHDSVKSFKIASYCEGELAEPTPFEIYMRADEPEEHRQLEELDLGTHLWPEIWKKDPGLFSTIRGEEWIPNLMLFQHLRTLKLLWAKNLLSLLRLTDVEVLPNLQLLEFVGDKCVDRYMRAAVKRCRPNLTMVQHKDCCCLAEDWWYMHDSDSKKIFQRLFTNKSGSGISYVLKNIGLGFMTG